MTVSKDDEEDAINLQKSVNEINNWMRKWRNKLNEAKSTNVSFTAKRDEPIPIRTR